jgi:hypothetical protein
MYKLPQNPDTEREETRLVFLPVLPEVSSTLSETEIEPVLGYGFLGFSEVYFTTGVSLTNALVSSNRKTTRVPFFTYYGFRNISGVGMRLLFSEIHDYVLGKANVGPKMGRGKPRHQWR